jgi:AbrB family looped-hinge helix DNA binding protein
MKITSKGQVTIPLGVREQLGLFPYSEVEFVVKGKNAYIHKSLKQPLRGQAIINTMRGKGTVKMSTDEIMALTRGEK